MVRMINNRMTVDRLEKQKDPREPRYRTRQEDRLVVRSSRHTFAELTISRRPVSSGVFFSCRNDANIGLSRHSRLTLVSEKGKFFMYFA